MSTPPSFQSLRAVVLPDFLLTLLINTRGGGGKSVVDMAIIKEEEKETLRAVALAWEHSSCRRACSSPSDRLQHLQEVQNSDRVLDLPGSHWSPGRHPARHRDRHPCETQHVLLSTSIYQDNPIKSFTVRTWRWQQHIITNISSFYMVIIYSIFLSVQHRQKIILCLISF